MTSKDRSGSRWFVLLIVVLFSVAAPLAQFKVPPVMPILMRAFSLSAGKAGFLMSIFALTGLILALPGGFIFQRLGFRATGLIAIFAIIAGALLGALSTSIGMLLASRFIEGIGLSLTTIVAPAVIAMRFTTETRGKAMGIWCGSVPLGWLLAFSSAPWLSGRWGWTGAWWFCFFYALLVAALYYLFIRPVPGNALPQPNGAPHENPGVRDLFRALRNSDLWLVGFVFACFNTIFIAFMTWFPTYCHTVRGLSLSQADLLMSMMAVLLLVSGPVGGWLSDRLGSRKVICVVPMLLLMFLFPLASVVTGGGRVAVIVVVGLIGAFVPTGVFSAGPEVVGDERLHGMAMAVILLGQAMGMLLGPLVFGWIIDITGGWQTAFWSLLPVGALGALAAWRMRLK
jgi:predicted MFS family arabinose efflux permease